MKILTQDQELVLQRERNFLHDLNLKLVEYNASREDIESMRQSIRQLDDLFLLVIVGEFNAGKSAFINALLGQKLLKEGVTPTTSQVTILRYGETSEPNLLEEGHALVLYPVDLLGSIYELAGIDYTAKLPHPMGLEARVLPTAGEGVKSAGLLKEIM